MAGSDIAEATYIAGFSRNTPLAIIYVLHYVPNRGTDWFLYSPQYDSWQPVEARDLKDGSPLIFEAASFHEALIWIIDTYCERHNPTAEDLAIWTSLL